MSKFQIYSDENTVGNEGRTEVANSRTAFSNLSNQTRIQPFRAAKNNAVGIRNEAEPKRVRVDDLAAQARIEKAAGISSSRDDIIDMEVDDILPVAIPEYSAAVTRDPRDDALWSNMEYQNEMHEYLREAELRLRPKANYMAKQKDISVQMRTILVDWLVEVGEEYKLHDETLHLAVNYIDRFLSQMAVLRNKLQLVGTACMYIASKYEEIYPPDVGEFVYITDDTYTKKQLLRMEALVCRVLGFELAVPTAEVFINLYCHQLGVNKKFTTLVEYLTELSMLRSDQFLIYTPSQIASAAVYVAYDVLEIKHPDSLAQILRYEKAQIYLLSKQLINSAQQIMKPETQQKAVLEKYRADGKYGVPDLFI